MASSAVYRQLTFYFIVIHKFHSSMSYGKYARLIEIEYFVFYSIMGVFSLIDGWELIHSSMKTYNLSLMTRFLCCASGNKR